VSDLVKLACFLGFCSNSTYNRGIDAGKQLLGRKVLIVVSLSTYLSCSDSPLMFLPLTISLGRDRRLTQDTSVSPTSCLLAFSYPSLPSNHSDTPSPSSKRTSNASSLSSPRPSGKASGPNSPSSSCTTSSSRNWARYPTMSSAFTVQSMVECKD
jgi:hypothetical protein